MIDLLFLVINLKSHDNTALYMILLPRKLDLLLSTRMQLPHLLPIKGHLRPFCALAPRGGLHLDNLSISFLEDQFEPHCDTIGYDIHWGFYCEFASDIIDFFVGDGPDIEVDEFCGLADYERRVDESDHRLMGYPVLHRPHRNPVDLIPEIDFFIDEMFVADECTFETDLIRQDETLIDIFDMQIPSLYHAIKQAIIDQIIPHRLANNNINLPTKIPKKQHLHNMLPLVLPNNLPHHIPILPLNLPMSIDNTENALGSHLRRIERVQAVAAGCQVEHCAAVDLVVVVADCFDVGAAGLVIG